MKIRVDNKLSVIEFGRRGGIKLDEVRYYYQVVGYDCLVLVIHGQDYVEASDKIGIALFDFDTTRGDIICQQFPKAPASWRDHTDLVQCTIRQVRHLPRGGGKLLSQAIEHMLGDGC